MNPITKPADPAELAEQSAEQPVPAAPSEPSAPSDEALRGIDEVVAGLDNLDELPLAEHVERFDAVHTELTVALSSIDKV